MAVTYFGSSTATGSGSTYSFNPGNTVYTQQQSVSSSGYITVGRFWAKNTGGTANARMVAYTNSSSAPGTLLGVSNAVSVPNAAVITEYDVTFPTPFHVTNVDVVWLGILADAIVLIAYNNGGLNTQFDWVSATYPNAPSTFGTPNTFQDPAAAMQLGVDSSYVPPAAVQGVDISPIVAAHIF